MFTEVDLVSSATYGHFDGLRGRAVCGWIWRPTEPHRQMGITVLLDGAAVATGTATEYRPDLEQANIGDGHKSFCLLLPVEYMDGREHEISVIAEDGYVLLGCPRRVVLPDLTFHPLPPDEAPYAAELAICGIAKNEARYILEWIAYHRVVGVDRFLIFDNESTDGTSEMLDRLTAAGVVTRVPWPSTPPIAPQHSAYAEGLKRLRSIARWIAFIDLDEFLHPLDATDVKVVLRRYTDVGALMVPWRIFGSSGEGQWRDELVIRRFTHRAPDDHWLNHAVKSITRGRCVLEPGIHTPLLAEGQLVDEHRLVAGTYGNPDHHPVPKASQLVINHYFGKSREEWLVKRNKGRADGPDARRDSDFADHDRNEVEDLRIMQFADAVLREMTWLKSLM